MKELELECKQKFSVEIYEGDISLTKEILPYFKKYSKIKRTNGNFVCNWLDLPSLTELPIPEYINGTFYCANNNLTSLEGAPEFVIENFNCSKNNITSLAGGPKKVNGYFDCDHNYLTSLKGAPKYVGGDFYCIDNDLTSLRGAPEYVKGDFYCARNSIKFTKEDVMKICDVEGEIYCQ